MKLLVPNQIGGDELRVALIPSVAKKLVAAGHDISIEAGAGDAAMHDDLQYLAVGVKVVPPATTWAEADIVLVVRPPEVARVREMKAGALLVGMLKPLDHPEFIKEIAPTNVTALGLELLPRITRAQGMDVLSSQANLAGYMAVIQAAERLERIFPMMMTAASTLQPAKVFVIGAGVAGLQAIATAKRLGAVVSAYDVRPAVKEQVQSVGAKFVELPLDTSGTQDKGGYAKELTDEQKEKQRQLMAKVIAESDVVITTALIPGRPAPKLIPTAAVEKMQRGSVIIDLAAEKGGNCELTQPGKTIVHNGVSIVGTTNLAATVPTHASQVYAANVLNLLNAIIDKAGTLKLDPADEVVAGILLCQNGAVVHPQLKSLLGIS
jgi:H+-translocating NAD(P) transhydrogenase subunit alpha